MSFLVATPEVLTSAAADLDNLGVTLNAAHAVAALPITGILAATAWKLFWPLNCGNGQVNAVFRPL
jgi:hypothetical protein